MLVATPRVTPKYSITSVVVTSRGGALSPKKALDFLWIGKDVIILGENLSPSKMKKIDPMNIEYYLIGNPNLKIAKRIISINAIEVMKRELFFQLECIVRTLYKYPEDIKEQFQPFLSRLTQQKRKKNYGTDHLKKAKPRHTRVELRIIEREKYTIFSKGLLESKDSGEDTRNQIKSLHISDGASIVSCIEDDTKIKDGISARGPLETKNIFIDRYSSIPFRDHSMKFCESGKKTLVVDNAGGKSQLSEALSIQYFYDRFRARNFLLEMEIVYNYRNCKMCDYTCDMTFHDARNKLSRKRIGVSVSRAMGFPSADSFTIEDAGILLSKKMNGLVIARSYISEEQSFDTCILHIWCQSIEIAKKLEIIYPVVIKEDKSDTLKDVIILLSVYDQSCIFENKM